MNRYFVALNVSLVLAILAVAKWLAPLVGGWALPFGMFFGGMCTAGWVSWEYHTDPSPEKEYKWRRSYFGKNYPLEAAVQLALLFTFIVMSVAVWRYLYFGVGMCLTFTLNILVEWLWAAIHRYGHHSA